MLPQLSVYKIRTISAIIYLIDWNLSHLLRLVEDYENVPRWETGYEFRNISDLSYIKHSPIRWDQPLNISFHLKTSKVFKYSLSFPVTTPRTRINISQFVFFSWGNQIIYGIWYKRGIISMHTLSIQVFMPWQSHFYPSPEEFNRHDFICVIHLVEDPTSKL